jgi:prepilin-type N-terminal cleavage/methylation domain-containing protein
VSTTRAESGFTLVEVLVSLMLLVLIVTGVASFVIQNSQINTAEQMSVSLQSDARNSLTLIENSLRTAGWDPKNVGFAAVSVDSTPTGADNYIEIFADLNQDDDTLDADEDITIRQHNNGLEWRRTWDTSQPFEIIADDITNDEDGDGTIEPLFTPDSLTNPKRVTVKITARSPVPDPRSGLYLRYTVSADVALRSSQ